MSKFAKYLAESEETKLLKDLLLLNCKPFINDMRGSNKLLYRGLSRAIESEFKVFNSHLDGRKPKDINKHLHDELNYWFERKFGWKVRNGVFVTSDIRSAKTYGGNVYIFFPMGKYEYVWSSKIDDLFGFRGAIFTIEELKQLYRDKNERLIYIVNGKVQSYATMMFVLDKEPPKEEGAYTLEAKKGLSNIIAGSIINVIVKDLPFDEWWKTKYSNVYLPEMIVNLYRKEGLEEAILSGNEISFKCDRYFMINLKYDELILEILNE